MSGDLRARFSRIRAFYKAHEAAILANGNEWFGIESDELFGDAYGWEHAGRISLTPIERQLWHDIRAEDAILYPQYPVGRYFVDWGNPFHKVAIECDGAKWHTDPQRDASRQREIEALGWTVYRLTGRECGTDFEEREDEHGALVVRPGAARALIRRVIAQHRIERESSRQCAWA